MATTVKRGWNPLEKKNRETIGRQTLQGSTLGFSDEIIDRLGAAYAAALTDGKYSDYLKEARAMSSEDIAGDWKEAPLYSFGANIAGGIPIAATGPAAALSNWSRGGSMLGAVGKGAAVGAGYGAVAGTGAATPDADGTLVDALMARGRGAGWGAAFGAGLGAVGGGLSRYFSPDDVVNYGKVGKQVAKQETGKAQKYLAKILGERPDLPAQLSRAEAMDRASTNTGIQLTLAEKIAQTQSDPLLGQQRILGNQPQTAGVMEAIYSGRSGTQSQQGSIEKQLMKLAQGLDPSVSTYDEAAAKLIGLSAEAEKKATKELTAQAGPLYSEAFKANKVVESRLIDRILGSDTGKAALGQASKNMSDDLLLMSTPDKELSEVARELGILAKGEKVGKGYKLQTLDYVKRALDLEYKTAERAGDYARLRRIEKLRGPFVAELDKLDVTKKIPAGRDPVTNMFTAAGTKEKGAYQAAREVYSGQPEKLALRSRIGDVADIDSMKTEQVASNLFKGRPASAEVASKALGPEGSKTAAAARIYDVMGQARGDPTSFAGKIAPNADTTQMLNTYAGGNQLDETLNVINQAKIGERFRHGSPTQPLQESAEGMKVAAGGVLDLATGNKVGLARKALSLIGVGEDPRFYQDMMELMTTPQGMDLVKSVVANQGTAVQKQQAANALTQYLQKPAQALGRPIQSSAVIGSMAPQQSMVFKQPEQNGLPPGFVIEQQGLPPGFILDRRQ